MNEFVAGVDEVGRSTLAGPIVAAAVVYNERLEEMRGIKDSKYTKKHGGFNRIENWFHKITQTAVDWAVGYAPVSLITSVGVHYATLCAMSNALNRLQVRPHYVFVDGAFEIPDCNYAIQLAQPKADEHIWFVAAASIVAKYMHDTYMIDLHNGRYWVEMSKGKDGVIRPLVKEGSTRPVVHDLFPYRFNENFGDNYPDHLAAIREFGVTPLHRPTFREVIREGKSFLESNPNIWRKRLQEQNESPVLQRLED